MVGLDVVVAEGGRDMSELVVRGLKIGVPLQFRSTTALQLFHSDSKDPILSLRYSSAFTQLLVQ